MGRQVVICAIGTKHPGIPVYRPGMEVWGINDCYQHCPEVKSFYKIYNIHKAFPECAESMPKRYRNWKLNYEKSKALIITAKDLGLSKQRILDIAKLRHENPDYCFCSSISFAIFEAVQAGYTGIRLYRLTLNTEEYQSQFHGIMKNIRWAQARGVTIYWPWMKEIQKRYEGLDTDISWQYGEEINLQYGEINMPGKQTVSEEDKKVKTVPVKITTPSKMGMAELRKAIKSAGGKCPRGAKKAELVEIYKGLK